MSGRHGRPSETIGRRPRTRSERCKEPRLSSALAVGIYGDTGSTVSGAPKQREEPPTAKLAPNPTPSQNPKPAAISRLQRRRAARRRQARLLTFVCLGLCALVLATSFPASALLRQRSEISSANSELKTLNSENKDLQSQADELSQPENIANLARRDYDMVKPGQALYAILPSSDGKSSTASSGSTSLNQTAIAPGSGQSQALIGDGDGDPTSSRASTSHGSARGPNLWGRVLNSLEFWR